MKHRIVEAASLCVVTLVFVGLGMLPIVMPAIQKPEDRIFNGMHGYLDDYVGYASYVKEGMYGRNTFRIRSLPKNQSPTSANLIYIWTGKIARIFGWNAPFGYHAMRAFLGAMFVFVTYRLFRHVLDTHWLSLMATILSFCSSGMAWYKNVGERWVYTPLASFSFIDNVAGRVTTRLHYILGAILFIVISRLLLTKPRIVAPVSLGKQVARVMAFLLLSFLLGITHPSFTIVLGLCSGLVFVILILQEIPWKHNKPKGVGRKYFSFLLVFIGLLGGLILSKWSTNQEPYVSILAFEEYTRIQRVPLQTVINDSITFGPLLWIGFFGLVWAVIDTKGTGKKQLFMLFWLVSQFLLFFSLFSLFRAERFRFIQSLYFIPMAYGTIYVLCSLGKKLGSFIVFAGFILLCILGVPSYIHGFQTDYYANTDYRTYYPTLYFPTKGQLEAFEFLDTNTPTESVVVASFEAANNIILYSHNYVIGNTQGWPKEPQKIMVVERDNFFSGMMPDEVALAYASKHDIEYVYNGWQEKTLGDVTRYSFLDLVFTNEEVQIYKVSSK